jgi:hypothetical protein
MPRGWHPTYAIECVRGLGERRIPVLRNVPQFAHRAASHAAENSGATVAAMPHAGISMAWRITQVFRFRAPLSELHGNRGDARRP